MILVDILYQEAPLLQFKSKYKLCQKVLICLCFYGDIKMWKIFGVH